MKFEYGDTGPLTGDKAKDVKNKGRPALSNFGKDTQILHKSLVNQSNKMMAQMIDGQHLGKITLQKEKKVQDQIINEEIKNIKKRYLQNFKDEDTFSDDAKPIKKRHATIS